MTAHDILFERLKTIYANAVSSRTTWEVAARKCYDLYNNIQWDEGDLKCLNSEGRPALSFNIIKPYVDAVLGSEVNNRRSVKFVPRKIGNAVPDELITAIADWFRYETNAGKKDSEIFKDSVICGIGWSEVKVDDQQDPDGEPSLERIDPFRMYWDFGTTHNAISDSKYLFCRHHFSYPDAYKLFPTLKKTYGEIDEEDYGDTNLLEVIECRYKETENFIRMVDPISQQKKDILEKDFKKLVKMSGVPFEEASKTYQVKKFEREVVKQVFFTDEVLIDSPVMLDLPKNSFGWVYSICFFDCINKTPYGFVKSMADTQVMINKFLSETIHSYSMQGKGGIFVEEGAVDPTTVHQFLSTLNQNDEVTFLKNGGLSKIQAKPMPKLDGAALQILSLMFGKISDITGVSTEFLGTREVNQPGILEQTRRQASLNILAPIFDNLAAYRKQQGLLMLHLIKQYLSDNRIIRILTQEQTQYIELSKELLNNVDYDILVDDEPSSLDKNDRIQKSLQSLLPMLQSYMTPELAAALFKYSNLPASFIAEVTGILTKNANNNQQEDPQQAQLAQMAAQLQQSKMAADIKKTQSDADKSLALAQLHKAQAVDKSLDAQHKALSNQLFSGDVYR